MNPVAENFEAKSLMVREKTTAETNLVDKENETNQVKLKQKLKPRLKSIPTTRLVVKAAFKSLQTGNRQHNGLSLAAIRKFIMENYLIDKKTLVSRMPFIRRIIKEALTEGQLVHTKKKGSTDLNGSFRLPSGSRLFKKGMPKIKSPTKKKTKLPSKKAGSVNAFSKLALKKKSSDVLKKA